MIAQRRRRGRPRARPGTAGWKAHTAGQTRPTSSGAADQAAVLKIGHAPDGRWPFPIGSVNMHRWPRCFPSRNVGCPRFTSVRRLPKGPMHGHNRSFWRSPGVRRGQRGEATPLSYWSMRGRVILWKTSSQSGGCGRGRSFSESDSGRRDSRRLLLVAKPFPTMVPTAGPSRPTGSARKRCPHLARAERPVVAGWEERIASSALLVLGAGTVLSPSRWGMPGVVPYSRAC